MLPSPADLYLLLDSPKQIRANGCTESWLLSSAVQRRALWGSRANDLSREKFRSCCRLRSVGMRHCLPREGVEESLLPSPPPPHPILLFLSQTGQSSEELSGMEWPHVVKRRRDKMAPGPPSSAVIHGSRQFPPRILSPRGEMVCAHLFFAEGFWFFCHFKQVVLKAVLQGS